MKSETVAKVGTLGLVITIFAESLMTPAGINIVSPSLPQMKQEFASHPWVDTLIPMVITLPGLLIALLAPFMGTLSDRVGVRPLLIGSTLVYMTIGTLPYWLSSLPAIMASRFAFGVAESALAVCGPPLIAAAFMARGRQAMIGGRLAVLGGASMLLALAGGWAAQYGWRTAYLLYGLAVIPLVLILLFVPKLERAPDRAEASAPILPLWRPFALTIVYGTSIATVFVFVPFLLGEIGYNSPGIASIYSGLGSLTTALAAICFLFVVRIASRENLFSVSFALMAVGCLLLATADRQIGVGIGVFAIAFGMGLFAPAMQDLLLELSPPAQRGKAIGIMMMCLYVGSFVAPFGFNGLMSAGLKLSQVYLVAMVFYAVFVFVSIGMRVRMRGTASLELAAEPT